ncbi:hypothetical protein A2U01_0003457, partial [Trifolium medium]|nr:hypothetical protein [Trifolium medium]
MEDAWGWLQQWFKEIRPWSTREIDTDRLVWLRVYGIPVHAWNDIFFALISKPFGTFLNADDSTSKKLTMDVARILIRTPGLKAVDDFLSVEVNDEIFQLRIIEDSHGPMRIAVSSKGIKEGRDNAGSSSEDEDGDFLAMEEVEVEVEREGGVGGQQLLALTNCVNTNNSPYNSFGNNEPESNGKEVSMESSNNVNYEENLNFSNSKDREILGEELKELAVGVLDESNDVDNSKGGKGEQEGGGISRGPQKGTKLGSKPTIGRKDSSLSANTGDNNHVRNQCNSQANTSSRTSTVPPLPSVRRSISNGAINSSSPPIISTAMEVCSRNPVGKFKAVTAKDNPLSSAGSILCCSSLNSVDIRNCNQQFWNKHETEVNAMPSEEDSASFLSQDVEWVAKASDGLSGGKRKLWHDLLEFKLNNNQGDWCIGGDFNVVLKAGERKGSSFSVRHNERVEFCQFVESMELVDIPVIGKKFSWFSADGRAMSRLDRFLLSDNFIAKEEVSGQWIGDRDISDHCPVWLICSNLNWGPKPFK